MDPRLAAIKTHPGSSERRYWPPGQHPATAEMRLKLAKAQELQQRRGSKELSEFIDYLKDQIAAFEESESERKVRMYQLIVRDKKGRR